MFVRELGNVHMDHPVALVLIAGVQIVVPDAEEVLDIVAELVQERITVPDLIEDDERKFVGSRGRHI